MIRKATLAAIILIAVTMGVAPNLTSPALISPAMAADRPLDKLPLSATPVHMSPRAIYLGRCGGCHGVDGHSADGLVPDLKDNAGYFLCDDATRGYAARLPNVAFSQISDADMAAMLNYVMFDLGGKSAPSAAKPYTAAEVSLTRRQPLTITGLKAYRREIVAEAIARCSAPDHLRTEYDPPVAAP